MKSGRCWPTGRRDDLTGNETNMKPKIKMAKPGVWARYAHAKLDGHFIRVQWDNAHISATTSHPTEISEQLPDHLYNEASLIPRGVIALGELWVPNKPASCVKTALKNQWQDLQITYFAIERLPGVSQIAVNEMSLEEIRQNFEDWQLNFAPFEVISDHPNGREIDHSELEFLRARARSAGLEGWVLKTGNMANWFKLKNENSIEAVITGVKDGTGKFLGQIGSLVVGVTPDEGKNFIEIAAVGGMTNEDRLMMTHEYDQDPSFLIGKVIEVQYQKVEANGRLRHPRFSSFRDDKPAADCGIDQDPDLEKHWSRATRFVETAPEENLIVRKPE
jgi:ATP-dependent DNA ligase